MLQGQAFFNIEIAAGDNTGALLENFSQEGVARPGVGCKPDPIARHVSTIEEPECLLANYAFKLRIIALNIFGQHQLFDLIKVKRHRVRVALNHTRLVVVVLGPLAHMSVREELVL